MNVTDPLFNSGLLLTILKFLFIAFSLGHIIMIMIVERQIHQADKIAAPSTQRLIELGGYINMILIVVSLIVIILPI